MKTPPALVLGRGVTPLGALRCLSRAGVDAYLPTPQPAFVRASRWYRRPAELPPLDPWPDAEAGPGPSGSGALERFLGEVPFDRAVLLACSDEWVERTAELPPEVAERFPASLPPADVAETLVDKGRFAEVLSAHGLPHPRTRRYGGPDDLAAFRDDTDGAIFLKPCRSQGFFRRYGIKAVMVDPRSDRWSPERLADGGVDLLLQEYVPGPPSNHVFVDGFVDRRGRLSGLMVRRRLRMYPPDFGSSSCTVSVPADRARPAVDTVRALLEELDYRGVFSAEFKRDQRDGVFRLLEVNARPWIFVEFASRCGIDVCTMAYRDALGRPVPTVDGYRTGRRLVRPYHDAHACRTRRREGTISWREVLRSWIGAELHPFALDDPGPAIVAAATRVGRFLRRRLGGGTGEGGGTGGEGVTRGATRRRGGGGFGGESRIGGSPRPDACFPEARPSRPMPDSGEGPDPGGTVFRRR